MSGLSNKEYKQLLKYYHTNKLKKASDPYIKEIVDVLAEDYGIEVDSDFISYAKRNSKPKEDSPFQTIAIIDIINAMIKLKKKVGDKVDIVSEKGILLFRDAVAKDLFKEGSDN